MLKFRIEVFKDDLDFKMKNKFDILLYMLQLIKDVYVTVADSG